MSAYAELSQRFADYHRAQMEQLHRLASQARNFTTALEVFLELPRAVWSDPKTGAEMSYIRLGKGDAQKFEEMHFHQLSSINGVMDFAVSVTLERAPDSYPKRHHIFQVKVAATRDGYLFTSADFEGSLLVRDGVSRNEDYNPLCATLLQVLLDGYDVSRIV